LAYFLQIKAVTDAIRPYLERRMSRLTASRAAFDLIASFEGFRTRAVLTPNGQWTLGFGHVATAREGLSVTRAEAEDLLRWDLLPVEDTLRQVALTPLSQNQFDALVSFAFNIGLENFKGSEVLKYLNQGQPVAAALSMHAWRRAQVNGRVLTIDALVRRRAAEAALFLEPTGARPAAPTSIVSPQVDRDAQIVTVISEQAQVEAPLETGANTSKLDDEVDPPAKSEGSTPIETASLETRVEPVIVPAPTSLAQSVAQPILQQKPIVAPTMTIPTPVDFVEAKRELPTVPVPFPGTGPMVPENLSPFPGSTAYMAANGNGNTDQRPANDGNNTRLHGIPEAVATPSNTAKTPLVSSFSDRFALLSWALMALGAGLLAFGLFYSWRSGILTVTTPRQAPTIAELSALSAAVVGFIVLVTSAVAAIANGNGREEA
jgi:lysozyme